MDTKIMIGCPTLGLTPDPSKWLISLLTTIQDLRRAGIDMAFCFPFRKEVRQADNQIVRTAMSTKCTHILRMDDDIWGVQPGDIMKLLAADKEFISAIMYIRGFPYSRCAFNKKDKTKTLQEIEVLGGSHVVEVDGTGIQPCDLTATPYTLWKMSLFEKLLYPYFNPRDKGSPDTVFCQKCLSNGIQPYTHLDVQLNHQDVTPWNRLFLFNAEARRLMSNKMLDPTCEMYKVLAEEFGEDGEKDLYMLKGVING
jgi:hypothetical protein